MSSIVARSLEVVLAVGEAIRLIEALRAYRRPRSLPFGLARARARGSPRPRAASSTTVTRPMTTGSSLKATIIPPTSQNQRQIEEDLIRFAPTVLDLPEDQAAWRCEQAVRNYDPCISCATHSLKFKVLRE